MAEQGLHRTAGMKLTLALQLLGLCAVGFLVSCATKEPEPAPTPAFGESASTIPWNQPQRWEGGGGAFNALRNGDDN